MPMDVRLRCPSKARADAAHTTANDSDRSLVRRLALAHFVLAVATLYFAWAGYERLRTGQYVVEHADEPIPAPLRAAWSATTRVAPGLSAANRARFIFARSTGRNAVS